MNYLYRGVWLPGYCPNRCLKKLMDQGMALNRIDGIDPKMNSYRAGSTSFEIRRWSRKLQRHSHRTQGHYISLSWSHCPHCGSKMMASPQSALEAEKGE